MMKDNEQKQKFKEVLKLKGIDDIVKIHEHYLKPFE